MEHDVHDVNDVSEDVNQAVRLVRWDSPEKASADGAAAWHRVLAAALAADRPDEPVPSEAQTAAQLASPELAEGRVVRWLATTGEEPVGIAALRLHDRAGQRHLAELELWVHPEHRRRGLGRQLLDEAVAAARAESRTDLVAEAAPDSTGAALLTSQGFERVLGLVTLRLGIEELDAAELRAVVRAGARGYRLARWPGVVPSDLAESYAAARSAMDERPMRGLEPGTAAWDAEGLHRFAEVVRERGDSLLTVAALYDGPDGDDAVAGFSEVAVPGTEASAGSAHAQTYTTAVVPEHRGHGLGLWLKAAMLQWLVGAHPEVGEVFTECAEENRHMIAVNERLGFRRVRRASAYRLSLGGA